MRFHKQVTKEYKHGIIFTVLFFLFYICAVYESTDSPDVPEQRTDYRRY